MKKRPVNPHDRFFRSAMQNRATMLEFFEAHLPAEIYEKLDLDSLVLTSESQVDDELNEVVSDLVFSCKFKGVEGYIYLLVEHQSTPDPMMAFRVVYYLFGLLNKHLKMSKGVGNGSKEKLPIVYPMVYYHGKVSPYPYSNELQACFDDPLKLSPQILERPFQLIDLTVLSDGVLEGYRWVGPMAKAMKHIRSQDVTPFLIEILVNFFDGDPSPNALAFMRQLLNYVLKSGNVLDVDLFYQQLEQHVPYEHRENVMTIAEQLVEKGIEKGIEKGEERVIVQMLESGLQSEKVAEITKKPLEKILGIRLKQEEQGNIKSDEAPKE